MYDYRIVNFRDSLAVVWTNKFDKRPRHSLGTLDRGVAEALARQVVLTAYNTDHGLKGDTISEIVDHYFAQSEAIGLYNLKCHWNKAKPFFGQLKPHHITVDVCKAYNVQRKRKPETVRKEIGIIQWALKVAKKDHEAKLWMPPPGQPKDVRITRPQCDAIAGQMDMPHLLVFLLVARYTAGRTAAILSLTWDQIDFETRQINLRHSGRQKRRGLVPMHPHLAWALALAKSVAMSDHVVEYAGGPVKSIKNGFNAAVKRAGLPRKVTPHVIRHTAASWMAEAGVRMEMIAQYLGHTDLKTTIRVYARFSPTFLQEAMRALG